jgi:hypothetical protein
MEWERERTKEKGNFDIDSLPEFMKYDCNTKTFKIEMINDNNSSKIYTTNLEETNIRAVSMFRFVYFICFFYIIYLCII